MASKSSTMEPEKAAIQTIEHERVAELAHELFLARGAGDGHDLDDWLKAETLLQQQIRSSGSRESL
jgi:hypothetical protein